MYRVRSKQVEKEMVRTPQSWLCLLRKKRKKRIVDLLNRVEEPKGWMSLHIDRYRDANYLIYWEHQHVFSGNVFGDVWKSRIILTLLFRIDWSNTFDGRERAILYRVLVSSLGLKRRRKSRTVSPDSKWILISPLPRLDFAFKLAWVMSVSDPIVDATEFMTGTFEERETG